MLKKDSFLLVGEKGLGNPRSRVAHAMAWFRDELYLGVTHPRGDNPKDAARILRFDYGAMEWNQAWISPLVAADARSRARDVYRGNRSKEHRLNHLPVNETVPRHRGIRFMSLFQHAYKNDPVLCIGTLSQFGASLLMTTDGIEFQTLPPPLPECLDATILSFRSMVAFAGKLFVAPTGIVDSEIMDRNFGDGPRLFVTDNPLSGAWQSALPTSFGDAGDRSIFSLAVFAGYLYASTGNPDRGFYLWRTKAEGDPPFQWELVLSDGAWRYNLNETAATMAVFGDALYIGSGLPGLGYDKANDVGPAAFEILRVFEDNSWDLLVGTPRFTSDGFKVPLSTMGPGFDDPFNSVVWSMTEHNGCLYVGTHQWEPFYVALKGGPVLRGGFELWGTVDGENWVRIISEGLHDHYQTGLRSQLSTPLGLIMGTSNHQEIGRRWLHFDKSASAGGFQVWLGLDEL